jgi:hypothetical protein
MNTDNKPKQIKEGDFVYNIHDPNKKPLRVYKNKYGFLGVKLNGWFDWLPLGSRHVKITE